MNYKVFKHPQTGHIVRVKQGFNWWVFFFGPIWYFFNDMIGHGLGWLIAAIIAACALNILGSIVVWIIAGFTAYNTKYNQLLEKGYVDITAELFERRHKEIPELDQN